MFVCFFVRELGKQEHVISKDRIRDMKSHYILSINKWTPALKLQ